MKALKYVLILTIPLFAYISFTNGCWLTYTPAIILFGVIPILEFLIKQNTVNFRKEEEKIKKKQVLPQSFICCCTHTTEIFIILFSCNTRA